MKKKVMLLFAFFFVHALLFLTLIVFAVTDPGTIEGITIGDDTFDCGTVDDVCPSDYVNCDPCVVDGTSVDDADCCSSACGWTCTEADVVCGDSDDEVWKDETDSDAETVSSSTAEDCSGTCTPGVEEVIDDSNDGACVDTYYNGTTLGYDSSENCADDGILFHPYTYTSNACEQDSSCRDTDDDGDLEICNEGNWHDADESRKYCNTISGASWGTGRSTSDSFNDDYNNNLRDGYCDGDDGYDVTGAVVVETYRSSSYCEVAEDVTISIKDMSDTSTIYDTTTTTKASSWSQTVDCHEDTTDNSVGTYTVTLAPGKYYLVAEKDGLNTVTQTIDLSSMSSEEELEYFEMYYNAECQSDCTKNDRICYAECEDSNDCVFSSYEGTSIADYCDGHRKGYRYVLSETTDTTSNSIYGYDVSCCTGSAEFYTRDYFTLDDTETNCVENLISREKTFLVNGERVTIHFVLFSDPHPEKEGCSEYTNFACDTYGEAFC